jgi:hypothetical protein
VCLPRSPCSIRFDFSLTFIYSTWTSNGIIIVPRALSSLYIILTHTCSYTAHPLSHEYNARVCIKSCITVLLPSRAEPAQEDEFSFLNGNQQQLRSSSTLRFQSGRMRTRTCTSARNRCLSAPIFNSENQFFSLYARFYRIFARFINFCSCPFGVVTF